MPPISRSRSHLCLEGSTYYFRQVVPPDLRHTLGRKEIRVSLCTGYLTQARPLARRLTAYTDTLMHQIRNGELAVDALREIKLYMNDFLRRYLAENEVITIHALDKADPKIAPQTQYMPGNTEAIISYLKTLLQSSMAWLPEKRRFGAGWFSSPEARLVHTGL